MKLKLKKRKYKSLEELEDKYFGKKGTKKRDRYEKNIVRACKKYYGK